MKIDPRERRLQELLAACYEEIEAGRQPDLGAICREDLDLREEIEGLLDREQDVLEIARASEEVASSTDTSPPNLARLGEFRIEAPIGSGGMGHVFAAVQESLGRPVALKVLRSDLDPTSRLRFRREAEITAALDHPNIVPVYATGEEDGYVYIAMKRLQGRSLDFVELPMQPKEIARVAARVARALHAAHEVGVVHRDVKPANVILEGETPYVLDFGLARISHASTQYTQANAAVGTLVYMAPERFSAGGNSNDPRIDVYGLGALIYECLTGRPPFDGEIAASIIHRILHYDPPRVRNGPPARDLEVIMRRALDKDPRRRFQSAAEMAEDLERYLEDRPIVSRPTGLVCRGWKLARRNRVASVFFALALVASSILILALIGQRLEKERDVSSMTQEFDEAIEELDSQRAEEILGRLEARHSDPDRAATFGDMVQDCRKLETLLALMGTVAGIQNPEALSDLANDLGRKTSPIRELSETHLALAAVALSKDEPQAASKHLDRVGPDDGFPRAVQAFRAVAESRSPVAALAESEAASSPLDHIFTVFAFLIGNESIEDQLRELDRIDSEESYFESMIRAAIHETRSEFTLAYRTLAGLSENRIHRPVVLADMARLALYQGDKVKALGHVEEAEHLLGNDPLPALWLRVIFTRMEYLRSLRDRKAFQECWKEALLDYPPIEDYPWYHVQACFAAEEDDELNEARTHIRRALARDPIPRSRPKLEVIDLQLDWLLSVFRDLDEPVPLLSTEAIAPRESLARLGMGVARGMVSPHPLQMVAVLGFVRAANESCTQLNSQLRSIRDRGRDIRQRSSPFAARQVGAVASFMEARATRVLGEVERSWAVLEDACRAGVPEALQFYSSLVVRQADPEGPQPDRAYIGPVFGYCALARERAREVLSLQDRGRVLPRLLLRNAAKDAFECSYHLEDFRGALEDAQVLRSVLGPEDEEDPHSQFILRFLHERLPLEILSKESGEGVRQEALSAFHESLDALRDSLERGHIAPKTLAGVLFRWTRAEETAPVRERRALRELPDAEREDWERFWEEVIEVTRSLGRRG